MSCAPCQVSNALRTTSYSPPVAAYCCLGLAQLEQAPLTALLLHTRSSSACCASSAEYSSAHSFSGFCGPQTPMLPAYTCSLVHPTLSYAGISSGTWQTLLTTTIRCSCSHSSRNLPSHLQHLPRLCGRYQYHRQTSSTS